MYFTKQEREELKALSKEVFGNTSFWQNKLNKRFPLDSFEQLKNRIYDISENSQKMMQTMKEQGTMDDPTISLEDKLTLAPDTVVIPSDVGDQ